MAATASAMISGGEPAEDLELALDGEASHDLGPHRHQHHDRHDRHRDHAVDHRAPDQRPDRRDAGEIRAPRRPASPRSGWRRSRAPRRAAGRGRSASGTIRPRRRPPSRRGSGTASMPVPMMPEANSAKANSPPIGRSASAACAELWMSVMPCSVQRHRRRQHDEKSDQVRKHHADIGVELDAVAGARWPAPAPRAAAPPPARRAAPRLPATPARRTGRG